MTEVVLLAMLRSGPKESQSQQPTAPPPSAPSATPYDQPAPDIVVVGHGPDRRNATDTYNGPGFYAVPTPYFVPVPYLIPGRVQRFHRGVRGVPVPVREIAVPLTPPGLLAPNSSLRSRPEVVAPPATGIFFTSPARGIFFDR